MDSPTSRNEARLAKSSRLHAVAQRRLGDRAARYGRLPNTNTAIGSELTRPIRNKVRPTVRRVSGVSFASQQECHTCTEHAARGGDQRQLGRVSSVLRITSSASFVCEAYMALASARPGWPSLVRISIGASAS